MQVQKITPVLPLGSSEPGAAAAMSQSAKVPWQRTVLTLSPAATESLKVTQQGKAISPQNIFHVSSTLFGEEFRTSAILP